MNTSKRIKVILSTSPKAYDARTGTYKQDISRFMTVACDVSDVSLEQSLKVFGNYVDSRKIVHLLRPVKEKILWIEYQGQHYKVLSKRLDGSVIYIEGDNL
ncbi:Uncharacterised protein [Chlamydia trachomatis]|nr:Uncharacterised protein [Chlamydia trachomatis]